MTGAFCARAVGALGWPGRRGFGDRDVEAQGDGAQDGIGLDDLDLGGQELIGVVGGHAGGVLADDGGGRLAVDIDGGGGFVDGGEARGDHHGGGDADQDEGQDSPLVAAEDPEVVGERDGGLFGLGVGEGIGRIDCDVLGDGGDGAMAVAVAVVAGAGRARRSFGSSMSSMPEQNPFARS